MPYEEIMAEYMKLLNDGPDACKSCERRHFSGCCGCPNESYWKSIQ